MLIYEVVLTTKLKDRFNIAPMGISFLEEDVVLVSPFKSSHTYELLKETGVAVVNFVDNVEIIALSVLSDEFFPCDPAERIDGWILKEAYMYYEVKARAFRETSLRCHFEMEILLRRERRIPKMFNRASFAVIEGAILVSRFNLYPPDKIRAFFKEYEPIVLKTGGEKEIRAWGYLVDFLRGVEIL